MIIIKTLYKLSPSDNVKYGRRKKQKMYTTHSIFYMKTFQAFAPSISCTHYKRRENRPQSYLCRGFEMKVNIGLAKEKGRNSSQHRKENEKKSQSSYQSNLQTTVNNEQHATCTQFDLVTKHFFFSAHTVLLCYVQQIGFLSRINVYNSTQ
jgi:hypothetical protein